MQSRRRPTRYHAHPQRQPKLGLREAAQRLIDSDTHVIEHLHPEDADCDAIAVERALAEMKPACQP